MKTILLAVMMCLCTLSINAQKEERSTPFDEPMGWTKLLQLRNGNTCLIEMTKKAGFNATIFDASRKTQASGKLTLNLVEDKLKQASIPGIFDIGGDAVIFCQIYNDYVPQLIRIVVDGKTGQVKNEEKIAELNKLTAANGYAFMYGDVEMPGFFVEKDPESDFYAVVRYNTFAPETKDRIEILHYDGTHKLINKANYVAPNNRYKYTKYLTTYVHKDDYVLVGAYAFNTKNSGGESARFYVAQLSKGKTAFVQKELTYKEFYKGARCRFVYNKPKEMVCMVLITDVTLKDAGRAYDIVFQNVNPKTLMLDKPYKADFSGINDAYKSDLGKKRDFSGMVQGTSIDKSGNLIVLYQETTLKYGNGSGVVGTTLGDGALMTISPEGKVISSAVYPARIYSSGNHPVFNSDDIRNGVRKWGSYDDPGLANEQYFNPDLISTENGTYLLFNNTKKNMELPENKEPKLLKAISLATAVKYTYKSHMVRKEYLLAEPVDDKDNQFCNFSCSDYNAATKKYATIVTDPKTKKSSVLWFTLE